MMLLESDEINQEAVHTHNFTHHQTKSEQSLALHLIHGITIHFHKT